MIKFLFNDNDVPLLTLHTDGRVLINVPFTLSDVSSLADSLQVSEDGKQDLIRRIEGSSSGQKDVQKEEAL